MKKLVRDYLKFIINIIVPLILISIILYINWYNSKIYLTEIFGIQDPTTKQIIIQMFK